MGNCLNDKGPRSADGPRQQPRLENPARPARNLSPPAPAPGSPAASPHAAGSPGVVAPALRSAAGSPRAAGSSGVVAPARRSATGSPRAAGSSGVVAPARRSATGLPRAARSSGVVAPTPRSATRSPRAAGLSGVAASARATSPARVPDASRGSQSAVTQPDPQRELDSLSTSTPNEVALRWLFNDDQEEAMRAMSFMRLFLTSKKDLEDRVSRGGKSRHPQLDRLRMIDAMITPDEIVSSVLPRDLIFDMMDHLDAERPSHQHLGGYRPQFETFDEFRDATYDLFAAYDLAVQNVES